MTELSSCWSICEHPKALPQLEPADLHRPQRVDVNAKVELSNLGVAGHEISLPFAHSIYTRCVLDFLNGRGISTTMILERAGLTWQDLVGDSVIDYSVFQRFVAHALRFSGEPTLGFLSGKLLQPYHSSVGIGIVTSATIGQGLRLQSRYARLLYGNIDLKLENSERWSTTTVVPSRPLHNAHDFILQFVLGAQLRLLEAMRGQPIRELVVGVPFGRAPGESNHGLLGSTSIEFNQARLSFRIPVNLLDVPCVAASPVESAKAAQACRMIEIELGQGEFAQKVRRTLHERLPADPDAHQLASDLGVSFRTMSKRLADVGTTFSDLKENLRKSQAKWHLQHTEMSMEAIAAQLGYVEQASFSRAFKRWYRVSPLTMRRRLRCGLDMTAL